jgi:hypothetical protein
MSNLTLNPQHVGQVVHARQCVRMLMSKHCSLARQYHFALALGRPGQWDDQVLESSHNPLMPFGRVTLLH